MSEAPDQPWYRRPFVWVYSTYHAEGYPYTLVNTVADAIFVAHGASLAWVGLTSLLHLPWNLKFLWAPWVDLYETKRRWTLGLEVILSVLLVLLAMGSATAYVLTLVGLVFAVTAVVSATHDIAIDGFYLEALDEAGQSRYVGLRAAAYRVAMASGGGIVWLGGRWGWTLALFVAAAGMVVPLLVHVLVLPRVETRQRPFGQLLARCLRPRIFLGVAVVALGVALHLRAGWLDPVFGAVGAAVSKIPFLGGLDLGSWIGLLLLAALLGALAALPWIQRRMVASDSEYARGFVEFLRQPHAGRILAFVILFRVGESFLLKMRLPFLVNEVGMSMEFYGSVIVIVGVIASMVATLVGGYLIGQHGLRRWLWPFVLSQNVLNLLYMGVALVPDPVALDLGVLTALIALEHLGAGLGIAVFMVYLMRCCDPRYRATHMAILTAIMSLGFTLAGAFSGFLAEALGFGLYFGLTFVATIPGMILIFFIPYIDGRPGGDAKQEPGAEA